MDPKDLPSFEVFEEKDKPTPLSQLVTGTETIDLSGVLTQNLTISGSFNALDTRGSAFHKLLHSLPVPAFLVDSSHHIVFCNHAVGRLTAEYPRLIGKEFASLFSTQGRASEMTARVDEVLRDRKPMVKEERISINNRQVWARMYLRSLRLASYRAVLIVMEDLTLEKRQLLLLDKIERAKKEWEHTFDTVQDAVAILDTKYRVVRLNKAAATWAGIDVKAAVNQPCYRLFHRTEAPPSFCPFARAMAEVRDHSVEYADKRTGNFYQESVFLSRDAMGLVTGCVLVMRDITERRRLVEQLRQQATHDSLTNLLNRQTVLEMLASAVENARRYDFPLSLGICDLDDFKQVNDQFGHQAGDGVLKEFGKIVRQQFRRADFGGRYGGDEFLLVFPQTPAGGAGECLRRVRASLEQVSFQFEEKTYRAACSAGVAQFTPQMASHDDLIQLADKALYEAKRNRTGIEVKSHNGDQ